MAGPNTPNPWERRQDESAKAYEAFCAYREMGSDRSLAKVGQQLGKSTALMERWSARYEWVKRTAKWDDEQERIEREIAQREQAKAIRDMRKRHADIATAMIVKAARALGRIPEDEIKPGDISRMVDVASKLERISRGDVGEVIEERDGGHAAPAVTFYIPSNGRDQGEDDED